MLGIGNEAAQYIYQITKRKLHRKFDGADLEAPSGIEPEMAILQTAALPLGYGAVWPRKRRKRSR
jgi:hypothetical protein